MTSPAAEQEQGASPIGVADPAGQAGRAWFFTFGVYWELHERGGDQREEGWLHKSMWHASKWDQFQQTGCFPA